MENFSYIHQRKTMPPIMVKHIRGTPFDYKKIRWHTRNDATRVPSELYNHFLRLNNRRKTLNDKHFKAANYYYQTTHHKNHKAAKTWCIDQFGLHGFWVNPLTNRFWFVAQEDAVQFVLAWNEC